MTQDEIIRFAIQCRLVTTGNRDGLYMDALTEFAKLVAAKAIEQRTWVGLTDDDEILAISNTMPYADRFEFARYIEAKLKEKNNA
jgi:hypothetical protein